MTMPARSRIVLVKPPERSAFNFGTFSLAALAGAVRDIADVRIEDATALDLDHAVRKVLSGGPDLIGITAMGMESVEPVARLVRQLKAARPPVPVVCGGHGATCLPANLIESGADAVVIGEGEATFHTMLESGIRPGSPGTVCRVDSRLVVGPPQQLVFPLDRLVPPARDLMPASPDGVHLMETSRGCPHACGFCETTRFYQRRWRPFSAERVAAEVARLVEDYGAWVIHFADDSFAANPARVLEICRALEGKPLPAFFMASARADDLLAHADLLPAIASVRILRISVGVETLNSDSARQIGKAISPHAYRTAFERMRELGMFSVASLIVGLPGESAADRAQAVGLAVETGPDSAHFVPFQPLPGVPLAVKGAKVRPEDICDARAFTSAFFRHPRVQARLQAAVRRGGIAGMLASGAIEKHSEVSGSALLSSDSASGSGATTRRR